MNIHDLTASQLKRAAAIKEQLDSLNMELRNILGAPTNSDPALKTNRTLSASTKRRIAAAQRKRWKLAGSQISGTFSQASSQEKKHERGSESETVVENETLLGSEKSWQKLSEAAWRFGGLYGSTAFEATKYPKVHTHTAGNVVGFSNISLAVCREVLISIGNTRF